MKPIEEMLLAMDLGVDSNEVDSETNATVDLWEKFKEKYSYNKELLLDADRLISAQFDKDLNALDKSYMAGFRFGVLFGLDLLEFPNNN